MWIGDQGDVDTWTSQRGTGSGIVPSWVHPGITHAGMGVPGAGVRIKFARVFGSGRLDYVYLKPSATAGNVDVTVWENTGTGGKLMKGNLSRRYF